MTKTINPDNTFTLVTYNVIGKQATVKDARGNVTSYTYDSKGHLITVLYPDQTKDTFTYDNNGNRTELLSHGSLLTEWNYDVLNRVTDTFVGNDFGFIHSVKAYDTVGRVKSTTDPNGNVTTYGYDDAGRRISITDALHNTTNFGYDEAGNQTSMTDALQHTTTFVYDDVGRRIQTIYHDQSSDSVGYDELGRQVLKTDQAGKVTQFGYDPLGRLTSVTQFLSGQPLVTSYSYDEIGNRISQTDANGHTTQFAYDQLGRRSSRTFSVGQSESYSYDAAGNLASRTDFNGHTTTYAYDSMNRLLSKTADPFFSTGACAGNACGATHVSFTYTATGRRASMTDPSGTTFYGYSAADRLVAKNMPFGGQVSFSYDQAGNLTGMGGSTPLGANYTYDQLNRLTSASTSFIPAMNYTYDAVGNLAGKHANSALSASVISTSYTYDALNRLTNMQSLCSTGTPACATGTLLSSYTYTLGPAGNRLSVSELGGRMVNYSYDDLYRLTAETISGTTAQNGGISYTYDAVGNRKQRTSTVPAIPATGLLNYDANDRTSTDPYDANGNLLVSGVGNNVYDFENRLVQAGGVTIMYDGDGNRVQETVAGVTTRYLIGEVNPTGYVQVMAELDGSNRLLRGYLWGLQLIGQRDFTDGTFTGRIRVYGMDGHGSVRYLADSNGAITDTYDYDAFGNLIAQTGTTPNNYMFAGEQFDPALGVYYNRARYYDERQGRFWSMDSYEGSSFDPGSLHKYLYTEANPIDRVDPSGHFDLVSFSVANSIGSTIDTTNTIIGNSVLQGFVNCQLDESDCGKAVWKAYWRTALAYVLESMVVPIAFAVVQARSGESLKLAFSQRTYSVAFGTEDKNPFKGMTVYDVAAKLKSGELTPEDVPIKYVRSRPFQKTALIVNTRSTVALKLAGVPVNKWRMIDATTEPGLRDYLYNERLPENDLEDDGIDSVERIQGTGPAYIGGTPISIDFDL